MTALQKTAVNCAAHVPSPPKRERWLPLTVYYKIFVLLSKLGNFHCIFPTLYHTHSLFSTQYNIISSSYFPRKITDKCHVGSMDGPQVVLRIYRHVSPPQRIIATSLIARSLGITEVDVHISDPIFSSQPMGLSRSDFLGYWLPKRSRG